MDRAHKTVLWIEKFRCQNSNLNLPTIKTVFTVFRIHKIGYVSKIVSKHSFGILGPCRSRGCAWIVPERSSHGERPQNVITGSQNEPHVEMIFELNLAR